MTGIVPVKAGTEEQGQQDFGASGAHGFRLSPE
jgi:hypothetical protein